MRKLTKENFIIHDDVFEKLGLEYERCDYCIIDNVRMYKFYGEYRLINEDIFKKKRNSTPIFARIYRCNEIQSVKAKMCLEAYYGITRYTPVTKEVKLISFTDVEVLKSGLYDVLGSLKGILYLPNEEEAEQIIKDKHRRVKANGLRRIFNNEI